MRYYHFPTFAGIDALRMDEREVPEPRGNEVLLRMRAWSLNYRDLLVSEGRYGRGQKPDVVPLSDGAGEVVAAGDEVTRWRVGDRVMPIFMPNPAMISPRAASRQCEAGKACITSTMRALPCGSPATSIAKASSRSASPRIAKAI